MERTEISFNSGMKDNVLCCEPDTISVWMWGGGGGGGGGGAPGLGLQQTRFDVRGERLLEFRIATLILSEIQ